MDRTTLHYIDIGEFPGEGTHEEKMEYVQKKLDAINQYKIDHPKYADEIRKACKEETQQRYEEYLKEKKSTKRREKDTQ